MSPETFDLLAAGLVLLCCVWGFWRGALSQLISLAALTVALVGARWLAPVLERPIAQVISLPPADQPCAAWAVSAGVLLLGAALLAHGLAAFRRPPAFPAQASRWVGGLLGGVKGLVLLVFLAYGAVLAAPPADASAWASGSRVLPVLEPLRRALSRALSLPPCTDEAAARVEGRAGP